MALRARRGYLHGVPAEHRAARRRAGRGAPERRRPVDDRNAGAGAGASGSGARRLRDRRARVARQAQPGHAAAPLSRVAGGAARALCALGAVAQRHRRAVGAADPTDARLIPTPASGPRRSARSAAISKEDAASLARPLLADPRSADSRDGGGRARRQRAPSRRRRSPRARCSELTADVGRRRRQGAARRRHRDPADRQPAIPAAARSRCSTIRRRKSRTRRWRASARRAPTTSSSCRRWSRCCATAAEGTRARGARQLRRAGRRRARASSCATRTRTSGCGATFPATLAQIPVAEVGRRAGRGARGARRLPPLQGRGGARAAAPRAAGR